MQNEWFEDFFHGLALEFWRNAVSAVETERYVDFLERELDLSRSARILDIPCGNGRHALEFAARGYAVTAVDLSAEFIAEAEQASEARGLRLECIVTDMRSIQFDTEFEGAFCMGNSFGYLTREGNRQFLNAVNCALKPGAKFVIETGLTAESVLPALQSRRWHRMGNTFALSENRYEASESELHTDYTFIHEGVVESGTATYSIYTVAELKALLHSCGFSVVGMYRSTDRDPYRLADPRLILTAEALHKKDSWPCGPPPRMKRLYTLMDWGWPAKIKGRRAVCNSGGITPNKKVV